MSTYCVVFDQYSVGTHVNYFNRSESATRSTQIIEIRINCLLRLRTVWLLNDDFTTVSPRLTLIPSCIWVLSKSVRPLQISNRTCFKYRQNTEEEKKIQARKENTQNKINTQQQSCVTMNTKIKSQLSVSEVDIYVAQIKKILTQKEFRPFSNSTVWKLDLFWRDNNVCWTFWRLFWNVFFFVSGVVLSSFPVEFFMFNACF